MAIWWPSATNSTPRSRGWRKRPTGPSDLARVMDLAVALRERWAQRAALDEQLSALGPLKVMPEGAIERLDAINARLQKHQQRLDQLAQLREAAKREFAGLAVNESLWRQAARIEAFKEQEPWIAQLQGQIGELQERDRPARVGAGRRGRAAGLEPPEFDRAAGVLGQDARAACGRRPKLLAAGPPAIGGSATGRRRGQRDRRSRSRGRSNRPWRPAASSDLAAAMDRAGSLVSQLRRRVQIDERLDQLARYQTELEERSRRLVDRQLLPVGVLVGLGAVFVVGVVLMLAGLFMPASIAGSIGWALAVLGLAGIGAAVGGKVMLERSNAQQLDACQKQLGVLQSQVQQTKDDRDALDAQLPRGGGPIAEPAAGGGEGIGGLGGVDAVGHAPQRGPAGGRGGRAPRRRGRRGARRRPAGVGARRSPRPACRKTFSPKQVRRLAQRGDRIAEAQRRLGAAPRELAAPAAGIGFARRRGSCNWRPTPACRLAPAGPIEQLRQLAEAAARQEAAVARREAIRTRVAAQSAPPGPSTRRPSAG